MKREDSSMMCKENGFNLAMDRCLPLVKYYRRTSRMFKVSFC